MISFEKAYEQVINSSIKMGIEQVPLSQCLNRILARDVLADMDMPPFNKAVMDGYACRCQDLSNPLTVIEQIPAGHKTEKTIGKNQCAKIMTGGMIPLGADYVIMVEHTEETPDKKIICKKQNNGFFHSNICLKGEDIKSGAVVLQKGTIIKSQHISVLATMGCVRPAVYKKVRVGVIATGNEIVEPQKKPAPAQIRNSNSQQLCAQIQAMGAIANYYGIARDTEDSIDRLIKQAKVDNEVILLSGGVSMGDYDLVPDMLVKNNYQLLFRKVETKPGRPTIFGVAGNKFCFGLPGNPVSTFVIFEILVKPFLYHCMGYDYKNPDLALRLEQTITRKKTDRQAWLPVALTDKGGVVPVEYHGSAHINSLTRAFGLLSIPVGKKQIKKGTIVAVRTI